MRHPYPFRLDFMMRHYVWHPVSLSAECDEFLLSGLHVKLRVVQYCIVVQ